MFKRLWKSARKALRTPGPLIGDRLRCERLESRQLLSTAGVDFALSGFSWSNPSKITYSIPADGVAWDQGVNNLNATLNADFGNTSWKRDFAKALQTWAASSNLNVVPVADNNASFNSQGMAQGDPNFGDIRFGGFDFQDDQVLAQTYYPPPSGTTGAGDVELNTGFRWGLNAPYDAFSVMLHEVGHSFGLKDLQNSTSVENTQYGGIRSGLMPGDIAGIQAIYGPRTPDAFQAAGRGISPNTAIDLTAQLVGNGQATIGNVSLATIGDTEYFTFIAPNGSNGSLQATAVASGISSLSPRITVYDASMNVLGSAGDPDAWSNSPTLDLGNIHAGQRFIVAVTGATNDVFAVGAYALKIVIAEVNTPQPIATPPPTSTPTPTTDPPQIPQNPGGPGHLASQPIKLGYVNQTVISNQYLYSASDINLFTFQAARAGTAVVAATGSTMIRVMNQRGQVVASGIGSVSFRVPKLGTPYYVLTTSANGAPVTGYTLAIVAQQPKPRALPNVRARNHQVVPTTSLITNDRSGWKPAARVSVVNDRFQTPRHLSRPG